MLGPHHVLLLLLGVACAAPPRGHTLPIADLTPRGHVVVDRQAGHYLGHPATALLGDGRTVVAVYPKGHGQGALVLKRSTDGGLTWSPRLPTPASWADATAAPSLFRLRDPGGAERLVLFCGMQPIHAAASEDGGVTWSELAPVADFGGIMTFASVLQGPDGEILALFHDDGRFLQGEGKAEGPPGRFTVYGTRSRDGGRSWSPPEPLVSLPPMQLCEPGLVRSPDGTRLALLLRENSRQSNSHVTFSEDGGASWSAPVELPGALTGDRHQAAYAPDGRLVVCFRDMALRSPTRGDWCAWVGTWDDLVHGREGQYRVRLLDNQRGVDCGYTGLQVLPDGTFVAISYGHWDRRAAPYVACVRFTLAELDRRAGANAAEDDPARRTAARSGSPRRTARRADRLQGARKAARRTA